MFCVRSVFNNTFILLPKKSLFFLFDYTLNISVCPLKVPKKKKTKQQQNMGLDICYTPWSQKKLISFSCRKKTWSSMIISVGYHSNKFFFIQLGCVWNPYFKKKLDIYLLFHNTLYNCYSGGVWEGLTKGMILLILCCNQRSHPG